MATYLDPKPAFLVHYEVMLTPKDITNPAYIRVGGRVLADTYLWPAMNDLDPSDEHLIRDRFSP